MTTHRVFLVDDHPIIRDGFRSLLENNEGFAVAGEAGTGTGALEKLSAMDVDLVTVDISMDGMDGIELTRRLTENGTYHREDGTPLKVLIISMHNETRYVRAALDAGATGYVLKDNVHVTLPEAARTVLKGERYLDPELRDETSS